MLSQQLMIRLWLRLHRRLILRRPQPQHLRSSNLNHINSNSKPNHNTTLQPETNHFPIQTVAIAAGRSCVGSCLPVCFAFKKGYITVEVVDEESEESVVGVVMTHL